MKQRILFVDDEELVLKGLERLLRPLRHEWDMEFVNNGAKALERMAECPFSVVVSDMRMPGMNGAELLNQVMKLYPRTVRLILSGYADRDLILKCVGSTHQYLAKPCEAGALKSTLLRAARMEQSLESEILLRLVTRCSSLPCVPALYSEIVEALQDPETDTETIGKIIVKDSAMTAKILKLVNSAFFGLGHQISSPGEAVTYLGTDTIKSLVLFANAFARPERQPGGFSVETLSAHSLEVAQAGKSVAEWQGADRKLADEAFIAGLLHDVGKLILAGNLVDQYEEVLRTATAERRPVCAVEKQVFGADHAEVGGYLLGLWGLPVTVVEAIALHHKPENALLKEFSPLTALHVGNVLASATHPSLQDCVPAELDSNYISRLGLGNHMEQWSRAWSERHLEASRG